MVSILTRPALCDDSLLRRTMHEDRKRVFVDMLRWDLPNNGEEELDEFDDERAIYLVQKDCQGTHRVSVRLLSTDRPHILGSIFPYLCERAVPKGPDVMEITRYVASPRAKARDRLLARNMMARALVEYALQHNVTTYTAVSDISFLDQIIAAGWRCDPLGLPQRVNGSTIGAFCIHIEQNTISKMVGSWRYSKIVLRSGDCGRRLAA